MDYRSDKIVEQEPEEIRQDMKTTRAAITDKLELIEERVTEKVETVQHKVEETVDTVKHAVQDSVQTVKRTLDWKQQMRDHPWAMVGGAVLAGFVVSRIGSGQPRHGFYPAWTGPGEPSGHAPREHNGGAGEGSGMFNKTMTQFKKQIGFLEGAAIAAAGGVVERMVSQAIPGLGSYLSRSHDESASSGV